MVKHRNASDSDLLSRIVKLHSNGLLESKVITEMVVGLEINNTQEWLTYVSGGMGKKKDGEVIPISIGHISGVRLAEVQT